MIANGQIDLIAGAIACVTLLILARRPPVYLYPPVLMSLFMASAGAVGILVWNLSAPVAETGLPMYRMLSQHEAALIATIFRIAALAPLSLTLLVLVFGRMSGHEAQGLRRVAAAGRIKNLINNPTLLSTTLIAMIVWLGGQGSAVWEYSGYLAASGPVLLQRIANPLAPVALLASSLLGRRENGLAWVYVSVATLGVWWCLLLAKGTRLAMAVPLLLGALALYRSRTSVKTVVWATAAAYGALASVQTVVAARSQVNGIKHLATLVFNDSAIWPLGGASLGEPVAFLGKNLSGFVVVTGASVSRAPGADVLVNNLNPLPRVLGGGNDYDVERYWPFHWIPLSSLGEVYGVAGGFALFAGLFLVSGILVLAASGWRQGGIGALITLATLGMTPILTVFLVQYSTRNTFRIVWILAAFAALQGCLRLHRQMTSAKANGASIPNRPFAQLQAPRIERGAPKRSADATGPNLRF